MESQYKDARLCAKSRIPVSVILDIIVTEIHVMKFNQCKVNKKHIFITNSSFLGKVSVALHHLELFPVNEKATFQIHVDTTDNAELAVSVTGPRADLPVEVTGNVKNGFLAEFVPDEVGPYIIGVDYNNIPVGGTPFTGKAYDSSKVMVSAIPWGTIGKPVEFTVDASKSGKKTTYCC